MMRHPPQVVGPAELPSVKDGVGTVVTVGRESAPTGTQVVVRIGHG